MFNNPPNISELVLHVHVITISNTRPITLTASPHTHIFNVTNRIISSTVASLNMMISLNMVISGGLVTSGDMNKVISGGLVTSGDIVVSWNMVVSGQTWSLLLGL